MSADCPVCGGGRNFTFLVRRRVPVHQNVLCPDPETARAVGRGDLEMCCCEGCGFAFNRAFDPSKVGYGAAYDSTRTFSALFDAYLDDLARRLVRDRGGHPARILEIGCGQGAFLRKLLALDPAATAVGFDPSYLGPRTEMGGRLRFVAREFGPLAGELADVVVCRHVIEHVPDPLALAEAVHAALAPGGRAFFETPCLAWILEREVVFDLFYEHCSLFSASALVTLLARAGFGGTEVRYVFDSQYLILEAGRDGGNGGRAPAPGRIPEAARRFGERATERVAQWRGRILELSREGPTALWGAGAKGVTLANLVDPDCRMIDCVIDVNRNKQGRFVPGTGHPIVDPGAARGRSLRSALLMNPVYRGEVEALLAERRLTLRVLAVS